VLLAPPEGIWGMPADLMQKLPGYDPTLQRTGRKRARSWRRRAMGGQPAEAQSVDAQHCALPRPGGDPARPAQKIYIDAELELLETTQWYPKVRRRDYSIGANLTGNGIDDPDQTFYENYACDSEATTTATATPRSTNYSTSSRWRSTRKSARRWSGTLNAAWPKTSRVRSSITAARDLLAAYVKNYVR